MSQQYPAQAGWPPYGTTPYGATTYAPPPPPPRLPVVETEYHHFWRTPAWRWWRPVLALLAFGFLFFLLQIVVLIVAVAIDASTGRVSIDDFLDGASRGEIQATPVFFLSNNVGLAALIPVSLLLGWGLFGQRPKWLSSVVGGIRWGWLLRCTLLLLPLWLAYMAFDTWRVYQADGTLGLEANTDTWLLLVGILLTTPFQGAGEEYAFRGFLARSASSFFPWSKVGLIVSMIFSSTLFMLAHGAGDPWLNFYYFSFGLIASILTWWTGGLEAAIAMHAVNNVLSEIFLPFQDISGMFDRQAGVAGPEVLIGVFVPVAGLALIMWQARRHGIVRTSAPARGQDPVPAWQSSQNAAVGQWPYPAPPGPAQGGTQPPGQTFPPGYPTWQQPAAPTWQQPPPSLHPGQQPSFPDQQAPTWGAPPGAPLGPQPRDETRPPT